MKVGIPKEVKDNEFRVAATPEGVRELVADGHDVVVETAAGVGSAIGDEDFAAAGASIVADADEVFAVADMIVKVKEPQPQEFPRFREGQVLFTYLHLAADEGLTGFLAERRVQSVAYETVQTPDGRLPLLAPMSEIAGRMAPQEGAAALERPHGGRGVLMGGASGVAPARVVVLGAGMAGANAAQIAAGMEAEVTVVDRNVDRLRDIDRVWHGRIQTVMSSGLAIERRVLSADLVVGAVLVPGAKAPHSSMPRWSRGCSRARSSSTSRSTRAGVSKPRTSPRTRIPRTSSTASCTTASGTCPGPCRAPRHTR